MEKRTAKSFGLETTLFELNDEKGHSLPPITKGKVNTYELDHGVIQIASNITILKNARITIPKRDNNLIEFRIIISDFNTCKNKDCQCLSYLNTITLLSPDKELSYDTTKGMILHFISLFFEKNWIKDNLDPNSSLLNQFDSENFSVQINDTISCNIIKQIGLLLKLNEEQNALNKLKIRTTVNQLLIQIFETNKQEPAKKTSTDFIQIMKIKRQIQKYDFQDKLSLNTLSTEASMSVSKLSKSFKDIVGKSIFQYYLAIKMEKAYFMLKSGKYSITDTAYVLGYQNTSKFTSSFKKHHGKLPSEIINQLTIQTKPYNSLFYRENNRTAI